MNRNRLPTWINAVIDKIADSPMSPIGRIAARRLGRPAPQGSIEVTTFGDVAAGDAESADAESASAGSTSAGSTNAELAIAGPTSVAGARVLIAPVNYSAQGRAWARALELADARISARNMAMEVPGGFSFDADLLVPVGTYHNDVDWQQRQLEAASHATHVLIEAEEPPFGRLLGRSVVRQASALTNRGVNVAYMAHGTDARLPSRHAKRSEWSYYRDPSVYLPRAESLAARNIRLITDSGRPAFVSTPDLLVDLPQATWCPVVVDPERWAAPIRVPRPTGSPLRVVHAPSNPVLKGTPLIMPTLEKLAAEGIIEFQLIQGVPSTEMPGVFASADVLLDQFRLGSYGVAACEAMAAGCVVVGQVSDQVRTVVRNALEGAAASDATDTDARDHSGADFPRADLPRTDPPRTDLPSTDLPIVEATPDTLEATLRELAADPDLIARSAASTSFIREVHDGRLSARTLIDNWIDGSAERKDAAHAPRS